MRTEGTESAVYRHLVSKIGRRNPKPFPFSFSLPRRVAFEGTSVVVKGGKTDEG